MKKLITLAIMLLCLASAVEAKTNRALVFGLGKQLDPAWGKIHGDNDVNYVVKMLKKSGFTDINTLKNEQATKQAMVEAFLDLAMRCKKGDVVYIHYSGHGQLMTDVNGDEALRKKGRSAMWDESWVPYDAYMSYCKYDRGEKHLCDDEIASFLSFIRSKIGKEGKLIVAVDACHSGDATSGPREYTRGVDTKFLIPLSAEEQSPKVYKEEWQTISACKPHELSTEMVADKQNVGKLTYALYTSGNRLFTMGNTDLQQYLTDFMKKNKGRVGQTPVVTGNK